MRVSDATIGLTGGPIRDVAARTDDKKGSRDNSPPTPAVTVSLSLEAQRLLAQGKADPMPDTGAVLYAPYFPTRDGYDADALAAAVHDPAKESSSAGKTLEHAAADARASMDAKYAAMNAGADPFDAGSFEGRDWNALMGDLDRRSLLAIRENTGNLFSKDEQNRAQGLMSQQQGLAMGLYSGPSSQMDKFNDPFFNNVTRLEAAGAWLDRASSDEKMSGDWLEQRLSINTAAGIARQDAAKENDPKKPEPPMTLLDILMEADKRRAKRPGGLGNDDLALSNQSPKPAQDALMTIPAIRDIKI